MSQLRSLHNEFQELEISKLEGYRHICQDIEFKRASNNEGAVNWSLLCAHSLGDNSIKINRERVSYAVNRCDDSSMQHRIIAEIDFEIEKLKEDIHATLQSTEDTLAEFIVDTNMR